MANPALSWLDPSVLPESLQDAVAHGEVFTRRWKVETILDLVGYTADRDLADLRIVELPRDAGIEHEQDAREDLPVI